MHNHTLLVGLSGPEIDALACDEACGTALREPGYNDFVSLGTTALPLALLFPSWTSQQQVQESLTRHSRSLERVSLRAVFYKLIFAANIFVDVRFWFEAG